MFQNHLEMPDFLLNANDETSSCGEASGSVDFKASLRMQGQRRLIELYS
jgi:hypothetical protein